MTVGAPTGRPLLLVDVDGVLNCFGDLGRSLVSFEQEFLALERYRIKVPRGAASALLRLSKHFECVWATTWEELAHTEIGARLGLPPEPWPYIEFDMQAGFGTAKLPAVTRYVGERPAAWIDDELYGDAFEWAEDRNARGAPTLLVRPHPSTGLEPGQVEQLVEWAICLRRGEIRPFEQRD